MSKSKTKQIPLATELWAEVYEILIERKVKFPKDFDGVGAAYAGLCAIQEVLKKRGINL